MLSSATGKNNTLTPQDLSAFSTKRRREARASNSEFTQSTIHKIFGSSKYVEAVFTFRLMRKLTDPFYPYSSSTLLMIFGGRVDDLNVFLKEERLPAGWEPRIREPWGLTIAAFIQTVLRVELGIDESKGSGAVGL